MEKYTKFLCLNFLILVLGVTLGAENNLHFKGDYFLFSDDQEYLYGGGNIVVTGADIKITGRTVYLRTQPFEGIIYGGVKIFKRKKQDGKDVFVEDAQCDAVFLKGMPPRWLRISFIDSIALEGDTALKTSFLGFIKKTPEELKDSSLYFEFKEFRVNRNKKMRAKIVIPYMMGLPAVPLRRFTVKRGEWEDKTLLAFKNINYSVGDGLSVKFMLRLRETFLKGDYTIKLFERKLFNLAEPKRGILFSGRGQVLVNKREFLNYSAVLNSGEESFNVKFNHRKDFKYFSYSLSQRITGRKQQPAFFEFSSELTLKPLKIIVPTVGFTYDFKNSTSYRVSSPLNLVKRMRLNVSWQRRTIRGDYRSDTADISASLNYRIPLFSLASSYNYSKNLLESSIKNNFSANLRLKPLLFLRDNLAFEVSTFCMFSSLPYGDRTETRFSPGINFALRSGGAVMPLGFKLVPAFTFNHLWDKREDRFTDFNYMVSLQKEIGRLRASVDYSLASRYRADNFWIEGSNRQNVNLSFQFKDLRRYDFLLRFYYNDNLRLENISLSGQLNLPWDLRFSSFILYYNHENRFQTTEIFVEKIFKRRLIIQGGYSLALKRFFIKFLTT